MIYLYETHNSISTQDHNKITVAVSHKYKKNAAKAKGIACNTF